MECSKGTYTDAIGHRYVGDWLDGKRDGKGTYSLVGQKKEETDTLDLTGKSILKSKKDCNFKQNIIEQVLKKYSGEINVLR